MKKNQPTDLHVNLPDWCILFQIYWSAMWAGGNY